MLLLLDCYLRLNYVNYIFIPLMPKTISDTDSDTVISTFNCDYMITAAVQ